MEGHQVNTNEDLRARLPELPVEAWNAAPGRLYTAEQLQDYAIAALARQEEGREAVGILCGTSNGRLKALQRGLALARKWSNGTGVHDHTDTVVRRIAEEFRVALSSQEGDYTHPAPPSAGEGDAVLPCDVIVAPATRIRKGVKLSTLLLCIESRRNAEPMPDADAEAFGNLLRDVREGFYADATPTPQSGEATCDRARVVGFWNHDCPECRARQAASTITSAPASPQGVSDAEVAGLTSKQAWWAGARAGLGLPADTPRADVATALAAARTAAGAAPEGLDRIKGMEFYLHENPDADEGETVRLVMAMSVGNKVFCHRIRYGDNGICRAAAQQPGAQHGQEGRDG